MRHNENGNIRFNVTIIGSMFLMAPLVPRIADGEVALVDILLRWGIAFGFVGVIVIMFSFALSYQPKTGMYAKPHALEPSAAEIEDAMLEFQNGLDLESLDAERAGNDDTGTPDVQPDSGTDDPSDPPRRRASDN